MAYSEEKFRTIISKNLIYLYLLLFPLGQLLRIESNLFGIPVTFHPVDFVVLTLLILLIATKQNVPKIGTHFYPFLLSAIFSLLLSISMFPLPAVFRGSLFIVRLMAYFGLFVAAFEISKSDTAKKKIFYFLMMSTILVAVFGWLQYIFLPDLRWLKQFGWDDHLYRLAGTFLDPGFMGLILAFGFLISIGAYINTKRRIYLPTIFLFLASVAFTYSRASYISLLVGTIVFLASVNKRVKYAIAIIIFVFLVSIPLLPKPSSSGVQLGRIYSISNRIEYYKETFIIWKNAPVFGVGFNNICVARQTFVKKDSYSAHSCSGSDSGILMVLATTGVVGLMTLSGGIAKTLKGLPQNIEGTTFTACAAALFAHSFFTNSLFYPWVLGFMAILFAITVSKESS